jgi:hypothetical protein
MDKRTWTALQAAISKYKALIDSINADLPNLAKTIQKLVDGRDGPSYAVETAVVYNEALDDLNTNSDIKMILVADNPGRREQAAENRRYLVGPSGKIAEGFFRNHSELGIDFRKNVIILNKTPIHTPRTAELKELCRIGGKKVADAVISSQRAMAELLLDFRAAFAGGAAASKAGIPIWIIGYSEMKRGGIFEIYTETLKSLCAANPGLKEDIFFYRHFSMNQFTIDLNQRAQSGESLAQSLARIGAAYRERVLG